jgi:hypothetical protein
MENSGALLGILTTVIGILVTFGTAALKYLTTQIANRDKIISDHNQQTLNSNSALIEAGKANAEIAALVPGLLKENYEWMQRFDNLLVNKDQPK